MSVLVVDDATIMRIVLKDILIKHCKYAKAEVIEATSGERAIFLYKKHQPELVLLDIGMPGLSGLDVVKAIIQVDPEAKIIMCTSSKDKSDVVECIVAGAKDYIVKPPEIERIKTAITKVTGRTFDSDEEEEEEETNEADNKTSDTDNNVI